jgi:hypothetical protein
MDRISDNVYFWPIGKHSAEVAHVPSSALKEPNSRDTSFLFHSEIVTANTKKKIAKNQENTHAECYDTKDKELEDSGPKGV